MSNQASLGDISGNSSSTSDEDLQEGWKREKLDDLLNTLISGDRPAGGGLDEGDYISIGGTQINSNGRIELDDLVYIDRDFFGNVSDTQLQKHDILMTKDGAKTGEVAITWEDRPDIVTNEHVLTLRTKDRINQPYVFYYLYSHEGWKQIHGTITGSAQEGINMEFAGKVDIEYPELPEQRRIAAVLYNVDQAIKKTEEIIEHTQRVKKGLMQDLFTEGYFEHEEFEEHLEGKMPASWNRERFGDILESTRNGIYKSEKHQGSGTPILKMGDMFDDLEFDGMPEERLELTEKEAEKYEIEKGDLLFARRSLNVEGAGKCTLIGDLSEGMVFESSMIRARLKDEANPNYLAQYFNSPIGEGNISRIVMTLAASGIRSSDLKNLKISMPGRDEQEKIAEVLFDYDEKIQALKGEKEQLQCLKKGLMQDLLTGKVRTKNKDIEVLPEVLEVEE